MSSAILLRTFTLWWCIRDLVELLDMSCQRSAPGNSFIKDVAVNLASHLRRRDSASSGIPRSLPKQSSDPTFCPPVPRPSTKRGLWGRERGCRGREASRHAGKHVLRSRPICKRPSTDGELCPGSAASLKPGHPDTVDSFAALDGWRRHRYRLVSV
jgi:hypothetical protein